MFQNKVSQPLERENLQACVTGQGFIAEELAFELERCLFGSKQYQGRTVWGSQQLGANLRQTAKRLAAAGWTKEKAHAHILFCPKTSSVQSNFITFQREKLAAR